MPESPTCAATAESKRSRRARAIDVELCQACGHAVDVELCQVSSQALRACQLSAVWCGAPRTCAEAWCANVCTLWPASDRLARRPPCGRAHHQLGHGGRLSRLPAAPAVDRHGRNLTLWPASVRLARRPVRSCAPSARARAACQACPPLRCWQLKGLQPGAPRMSVCAVWCGAPRTCAEAWCANVCTLWPAPGRLARRPPCGRAHHQLGHGGRLARLPAAPSVVRGRPFRHPRVVQPCQVASAVVRTIGKGTGHLARLPGATSRLLQAPQVRRSAHVRACCKGRATRKRVSVVCVRPWLAGGLNIMLHCFYQPRLLSAERLKTRLAGRKRPKNNEHYVKSACQG